MARPAIQDVATTKVESYIEAAIHASPAEMPLSTLAVAKAVGHDRRVLAKYGLDARIAEAAKIQKRTFRSSADQSRRVMDERLAAASTSAEQMRAQLNALLARLALVEGNAKRIGIDPEELYRPMLPPDRSLPSMLKGRARTQTIGGRRMK